MIGSMSNVQLRELLKQASVESERIVVPTVRRTEEAKARESPEKLMIADFNASLLKLEAKLVENQKNTGTLIRSIRRMKRGVAQLNALQARGD